MEVYPLYENGVLYGAIQKGDHLFYITENGKEEHLDGQAKFMHVWPLENGEWKMVRVLSCDHRPPNAK